MKTTSRHFLGLFFTLLVIGFGIAYYQIHQLGLTLNPSKIENVWKVNLKFQLEATPNEPVKATFFVPNIQNNDVLDEKIIASGFGKAIARESNNRVAIISKKSPSKYQTILYELMVSGKAKTSPLQVPNVMQKIKSLSDHTGIVEFGLLQQLESLINERSADDDTFIRQTILSIQNNNSELTKALLGASNSAAKEGMIVSNLITLHGVPNIMLHVVPYKTSSDATMSNLPVVIAVYINRAWQYYSLITGDLISINDSLVLWSGSEPFINVEGGKAVITGFTIAQQSVSQTQYHEIRNDAVKTKLYEFSLQSLPSQTQQTYKIIVMIPIGVLVILLLRILVGVPTLGTFMPVLIALAFRETSLLWGIVFFSIVVIVGLSFRSYFESLKLLVVPRLGMILTIVVLIMACITVVTNKLEIQNGLSITLFPMVILTMTIERLSVLWEERGPNEALSTALGSLFSASVIYLVVFNDMLEYLFFTFPSLLLIVMALMLLIGKYRGYRLSELIRFKKLAKASKDEI